MESDGCIVKLIQIPIIRLLRKVTSEFLTFGWIDAEEVSLLLFRIFEEAELVNRNCDWEAGRTMPRPSAKETAGTFNFQ